jgi:multidrug efflux pump subunit AcrB
LSSASEQAQRAAKIHRAAGEEADAERRKEAEREYQARYKSAARRWVSSVVALPILLVTSYYLFDRCMFSPFPFRAPRVESFFMQSIY